jgi:hypothetical protein
MREKLFPLFMTLSPAEKRALNTIAVQASPLIGHEGKQGINHESRAVEEE